MSSFSNSHHTLPTNDIKYIKYSHKECSKHSFLFEYIIKISIWIKTLKILMFRVEFLLNKSE